MKSKELELKLGQVWKPTFKIDELVVIARINDNVVCDFYYIIDKMSLKPYVQGKNTPQTVG